ncbi:GDCCVxC domain-containing (seleno)protein [Chitinophaga sp. HK235]|uniref:GDCCVxC domain-containing (seleno)protein n=1 Tax=Chitinophaga sp. HK235 TaxID=2952571 RepID=UPI0027E2D5D4|nr:GDCCVxC domain-containing (seleno)protein [Chitinophaga sp. HK235]
MSNITCPHCGHSKNEFMLTNACRYFYECKNCHQQLQPLKSDCCVFCSYGSVKYPPVQQNRPCCQNPLKKKLAVEKI